MSEEKHRFEARRWLDQANEDLQAARVLHHGARFAQACFYCQQAAEKALKSLGWLHGLDLWGHSLLQLRDQLRPLGFDVDRLNEADLVALDRFYIPTRYPNSVPDIIPQRAFVAADAAGGLAAAERIFTFAAALIPLDSSTMLS
jgi:HEPN domain-containing protein